jgi:hypothetical protein
MVPDHTRTFQTRKPIEGVRRQGGGIESLAVAVAVVVLFVLLVNIFGEVRAANERIGKVIAGLSH